MKSIVSLLVVLFCYTSFSQILPPEVNKAYFILGTLNDYMGRALYKSISSRVDYYYDSEKPLAEYIASILKEEDLSARTDTSGGIINILCRKEAKEINAFFRFKNDSFRLSILSIKTAKFETEHVGYLKRNIFTDSIKMYSYLLGAYLRYGQKKDSTFCLKTANSLNTFKSCKSLLLKLGCSNIRFVESLHSIPVIQSVYFNPTTKLRGFFDSVAAIKKETADYKEEKRRKEIIHIM